MLIVEIFATAAVVTIAHNTGYIANVIRQISRSGINISGQWQIMQSDTPVDGEQLARIWRTSIKLKQMGDSIKGSATASCTNCSVPPVAYKVIGSFRNGYLEVVFRDLDDSRMSISTFLLKANMGGTMLVGHRLFSGVLTDKARAIECHWHRPGSDIGEMDCGQG